MFIGIDDTDSEKGLCTTYLAAVLMNRLRSIATLKGIPKLVRLNPCIKYKTRGNAAIAFEIETEKPDDVKDLALRTVMEFSDLSGANTNPGLIAADRISDELKRFYKRAVTEILEIQEARDLLDSQGIWYRGLKKGRGLIGALAAAGADLEDYTYELIAYRERSRWGTQRQIDPDSVWKADALTYPMTWDTVDHQNNRIVFAPHSGDPVLFGIRGRDIDSIELAFQNIRSEPYAYRVLYITNQGTDAHIIQDEIAHASDNQSYCLRGRVSSMPRAINGGHLFFNLEDESSISCAAFEPTKNFRAIVKQLIPGDVVEVYGAMRDGTLNLEKLNILKVAEQRVLVTPLCPSCGRRMESSGKGQGYRCRRCRTKAEACELRSLPRKLETGFYEVPPCARRHLAKPLVRMIGEKVHPSR